MNEDTELILRNDPVLIKLGSAREALLQACTMQDAKQIADIAKAAEIYARRQKLGQEAIMYAHAIHIDALRLLGEMLQKTERAIPGPVPEINTNLESISSRPRPPTLAELGIDLKTSSLAQKLAELPDKDFNSVKNGATTVTRAIAIVNRAKKKEELTRIVNLPTAKYRIIYADPPWAYRDVCDEGSVQSAGAVRHYPAMNMEELCAMPVMEWCEPNSVLFLWITSPLLSECWPLIEAWGFEYKSSFIWDKVKHNMGHYNSVRHELLLICTRGSCPLDVMTLFDSVQSIERTKHSEKPEEFRTIIDTIYPHGKRLELFARGTPPIGWETWGHEAIEMSTA